MLHAADIHIYRKHCVCLLSGYQFLVIMIVHIAQEIPGRTRPLRHGVGLALGRLAAHRALTVDPLLNSGKRRLPCSCRLIGLYLRQSKRKLFFRHRDIAAVRTVHDRNRLAPVALTGKYPVAQLIIHGCTSDSPFFYDMRRFLLKDCRLHAIPLAGIDHGAACLRISFCHMFDLFAVFGNNLDDRNTKLRRELKVTVIVGRNTHDRTRTIISQNIIRQPDRGLLPIQRVDGIASGEYTRLLLILHTVHIRLHGCI